MIQVTIYEPDPEVRARLETMLSVNDGLLQAALARARAQFDHPGNKGDEVEAATRSFLRSHLPRAYSIGHGEVIDRFGSRSSQLDVLILSDAQPFIFPDEVAGVFLVEGVVGAGEVKSRLTTTQLDDVLNKARRFRTLRGMQPAGTQAYASPADTRRFLTSPPTFALAVETAVSAETTLERLSAAEMVSSPDPLQSAPMTALDAIFVLGQGAFIYYGGGEGSLQYLNGDGVSVSGWVFHETQFVLAHMFLWLHAVVPRFLHTGSVAPSYFLPTRVSGSD